MYQAPWFSFLHHHQGLRHVLSPGFLFFLFFSLFLPPPGHQTHVSGSLVFFFTSPPGFKMCLEPWFSFLSFLFFIFTTTRAPDTCIRLPGFLFYITTRVQDVS